MMKDERMGIERSTEIAKGSGCKEARPCVVPHAYVVVAEATHGRASRHNRALAHERAT